MKLLMIIKINQFNKCIIQNKIKHIIYMKKGFKNKKMDKINIKIQTIIFQ